MDDKELSNILKSKINETKTLMNRNTFISSSFRDNIEQLGKCLSKTWPTVDTLKNPFESIQNSTVFQNINSLSNVMSNSLFSETILSQSAKNTELLNSIQSILKYNYFITGDFENLFQNQNNVFGNINAKYLYKSLQNHYTHLIGNTIPKFENINFDDLEKISNEICLDGDIAEGQHDKLEETVPYNNIKTIINFQLENSKRSKDIETSINGFISEIQKSNNPYVRKILFEITKWLIQFLFCYFLTANLDASFKQYFLIQTKSVSNHSEYNMVKIIRKKITTPNSYIKQVYRIVSIENLNVRQCHSKKSPILGSLNTGCLVKIIRKKKNWTLIEWVSDDDQVSIKGWVFTRYLVRLK